MEKKITWNLYVYGSIAGAFDAHVKANFRGDKGTTCSAALLMFMQAPKEEQQEWVDRLKLAEGRGTDGSILEASQKIISQVAIPASGSEAPVARKSPGTGGSKEVVLKALDANRRRRPANPTLPRSAPQQEAG